MTSQDRRWITAVEALTEVSQRFQAVMAIEAGEARSKAIEAMFLRLAAGTLRASPKGLCGSDVSPSDEWKRWFRVRVTESDGRAQEVHPDTDGEWDFCAVPLEFWRLFQSGKDGCVVDWASGDFYLHDVAAPDGAWNGIARDVRFDRDSLPGQPVDHVPPAQPDKAFVDGTEALKRAGGRIPDYDWIGAVAHLVAMANRPDGLDPKGKGDESNASHLARLMEAWFDTTIGKRPSGSMTRKYAARVVGAINDLKHREILKTKAVDDD